MIVSSCFRSTRLRPWDLEVPEGDTDEGTLLSHRSPPSPLESLRVPMNPLSSPPSPSHVLIPAFDCAQSKRHLITLYPRTTSWLRNSICILKDESQSRSFVAKSAKRIAKMGKMRKIVRSRRHSIALGSCSKRIVGDRGEARGRLASLSLSEEAITSVRRIADYRRREEDEGEKRMMGWETGSRKSRINVFLHPPVCFPR